MFESSHDTPGRPLSPRSRHRRRWTWTGLRRRAGPGPLLGALAALGLLGAPGGGAEPCASPLRFHTARTWPTGAWPHRIAVGELDGDGRPDVVSADRHGGSVTILHGGADRDSDLDATTFPVGAAPEDVALVDLDGDGRDEIVVTDPLAREVVFLEAERSRPPRVRERRASQGSPAALAVGRFTEGPLAGLAWSDRSRDEVRVLLPRRGTEPREVAPLAVGRFPAELIAADVDGDGLDDLVAASALEESVTWLRSLGKGEFAAGREVSVGQRLEVLAALDLDRDGVLDLIGIDPENERLVPLPASAPGAWRAGEPWPLEESPVDLLASDLDGDRTSDLLLVTHRPLRGAVSVLLNRPDGDARLGGALALAERIRNGSSPHAVALADLDGDRRDDLVVSDAVLARLSVHWGLGEGRFAAPAEPSGGSERGELQAEAIIGVDLEGDGPEEFVVAVATPPRLLVLRAPAGGGEGLDETDSIDLPPLWRPAWIRAGDVNSDGLQEIFVWNSNQHRLPGEPREREWEFAPALVWNRGEAGLEPGPKLLIPGAEFFLPIDYDEDGWLDLVMTHWLKRDYEPHPLGYLSLFRGNGTGEFRWWPLMGPRSELRQLAVGDFDADGKPDLAGVEPHFEKNVRAYIRSPDLPGGYGMGGVSTFGYVQAIVVADLDGDGESDLGIVDRYQPRFSLFFSRVTAGPYRTPQFRGRTDLPVLASSDGPLAADLDGDGDRDLALISKDQDVVRIFLNEGERGFTLQRDLAVAANPVGLAAADLDGDGLPELGVACWEGRAAQVIWNETSAASRGCVPPDPAPRFVRGDIDSDRRLALSDAVVLLDHLFREQLAPTCPSAADVDDDGRLTLSDAVRLLNYLFRGGAPPPAPFPACGADPSEDELDCAGSCRG